MDGECTGRWEALLGSCSKRDTLTTALPRIQSITWNTEKAPQKSNIFIAEKERIPVSSVVSSDYNYAVKI